MSEVGTWGWVAIAILVVVVVLLVLERYKVIKTPQQVEAVKASLLHIAVVDADAAWEKAVATEEADAAAAVSSAKTSRALRAAWLATRGTPPAA